MWNKKQTGWNFLHPVFLFLSCGFCLSGNPSLEFGCKNPIKREKKRRGSCEVINEEHTRGHGIRTGCQPMHQHGKEGEKANVMDQPPEFLANALTQVKTDHDQSQQVK